MARIVMHTHHRMIHWLRVMIHRCNVHRLAWHSYNRQRLAEKDQGKQRYQPG